LRVAASVAALATACLGKMLRYANEIEILEVVSRIKLLEIAPQKFDFLTFEEFSRLLEAMDPSQLFAQLSG
jgi:hypothetical protein